MMGVEPALTNGPLGFPLEPGSEAAWMNAAPEEGRAVVRNLRLADSGSNVPDIDRLHEISYGLRQPVASIIVPADATLCHAAIPSAVRARVEQVRDQAEWQFPRCRPPTAECEVQ